MGKHICEFDENIVKALKRIKIPMINSRGAKIYFAKAKRKETIYEHIANKNHMFKERDISLFPIIIGNKESEIKDKKNKKYKNYVGKRKGINKNPYIKIITIICKNKTEEIVTAYTVRKIS